ncbi:hypothetical protein J2W70_003500 [Pseudomonas koreensis]|nr:hypothetical protein [Pseudomonas koreensis]MDR7056119.1 hypothetical protein [Pseudomonas koreensis]
MAVVAAAQSQRRQLKTPNVEVDKYLGFLQRQGLVESVKALGNYRAIL